MRAQLGYGFLTLGAAAAALGFVTLAAGIARGNARLLDIGRRYVVLSSRPRSGRS